jgi:hypothetical protein
MKLILRILYMSFVVDKDGSLIEPKILKASDTD